MATQVAKYRFQANKPVKAGIAYKHTVNGKDYIFQARFDKTLPEFNPMWFINISPKEYRFRRDQIPMGFKLQPGDKLVITDKNRTLLNENLGELDKPEIDILVKDTMDVKVGSRTFNTRDVTNRIRVLNYYPFANLNYDEIKFHEIDNYGFTSSINLIDNVNTTYHLVVRQTFTPVRAASLNVHFFRIYNVNGYTFQFTGITPNSYDGVYASYTIPNSIITYKFSISFNGNIATINTTIL